MTVTIEPSGDRAPDLHVHAGGQGLWVARMASRLGARATLCTALGGETGTVLRALVEDTDVELDHVEIEQPTAGYVHDRRSGERTVVAESAEGRLSRHEIDDLYGITLARGLRSDATLLTGTRSPRTIPTETYGRLASDLRRNGAVVLADLSDEQLWEAVEGGVDVAKVSDEELIGASASEQGADAVLEQVDRLASGGARVVLVTRAERPALAVIDGRWLEVTPPRLQSVEPRGPGDAAFAALGVAFAERRPIEEALKFSMAAGALNVSRHGLGTGDRAAIEALVDKVVIRPYQR